MQSTASPIREISTYLPDFYNLYTSIEIFLQFVYEIAFINFESVNVYYELAIFSVNIYHFIKSMQPLLTIALKI